MPRVLAAIGPESLGELLTEIALEHWPAAAVGDVLPALHVLDPDEADEPAVAIALDRAGSWAGLLALTSRDLVDQPFIQARPVLNTLFAAVLVRLAHPHLIGASPAAREAHRQAAHAAAASGVVPAEPVAPEPVAPEPVVSEPAGSQPLAAEPAGSESVESESVESESVGSGPVAGEPLAHEPFAHEQEAREEAAFEHARQEQAASYEQAGHEPMTAEQADHEQPAEAEHEHGADEHAADEHGADEHGADEHGADEPEPVAAAPEDEPVAEEPASGPLAAQNAAEAPDVEHGEQAEHGAPAEAESDAEAQAEAGDHDHGRDSHDPSPSLVARFPSEGPRHGESAEVVHEEAEPVSGEGHEPENVLDAPEEPAPGPAAEEALEAAEHAEPDAGEPVSEHEDAGEPVSAQPADPEDQELPELIEAAFAGLDDKTWAVAQNRVFTDEPSAVDQLAKLFAVPPAEISATEDRLRIRLGNWLASEEAAPYRAHLDELVRTLGPAVPKEQLIGAASWHNVEIRALEVPAWQFVLATLAPSPPAEVEVVPQSAFGPLQVAPPPGPPQFQAFTPVAPPQSESNGGPPEEEHEQEQEYQPLKDVSQTRRCFRQPDGRWWLRIDVTAEQLGGGECTLPTGFASYLGLSPGESRTVRSAAGELTMTWHGGPVLETIERLLIDVGAREGGHLFLTLSDEGVLRARHLPVAAQGAEKITKALRLVGYTAPGGTRDQAARVIATRIGMTGPVALPELLNRLRERGDRDLLELLD
ncbi:hypothetical protein [Nonomuraea solani]|nr:hypothetical protein [Nonomuraea solani]